MLTASTGYVDGLTSLLKSLLPVSQTTTIGLSSNGLLVEVVHKSQTCCARTLLLSSLFATYELEEDSDVCVSLKALTNCLQLFNDWSNPNHAVQVLIKYTGGSSLDLTSSVESIRANANVQCYDLNVPSGAGPELSKEEVCLQVISDGQIFADIVRVLERAGTTEFKVTGRTSPIGAVDLEGETQGNTSLFELNEDNVESIVVDYFCHFAYDFKMILKLKESLRYTKKTSLRVDKYGVLNVQMIHEINETTFVVDYIFCPLELA